MILKVMKKSLKKKFRKLDADVVQIVMAKKIVNVAQIALVVNLWKNIL